MPEHGARAVARSSEAVDGFLVREEERLAGDAFVALHGGSWLPHDVVGAPAGSFDLLVTDGSGDAVALEITQETTPAVRAQESKRAKLDWTFEDLEGCWIVDAIEPYRPTEIHAEISELIAELAATSTYTLHVGRASPPSAALDRFRELRIKMVHKVSDGRPGVVILGAASSAGSTAAEVICDVAADHAYRPDNVAKLESAEARALERRELWIWVTVDRHMVAAAIWSDELPRHSPSFPTHVDAVSVAVLTDPGIVFRWDRRTGWSRCSLTW